MPGGVLECLPIRFGTATLNASWCNNALWTLRAQYPPHDSTPGFPADSPSDLCALKMHDVLHFGRRRDGERESQTEKDRVMEREGDD